MSEINNNGFNIGKEIKVGKQHVVNNTSMNAESPKVENKQQMEAAAPVLGSLGKSNVKIDNHDMDMQRLLQNPKIADMSDKMFNAAVRAGYNYVDAATFATSEA